MAVIGFTGSNAHTFLNPATAAFYRPAMVFSSTPGTPRVSAKFSFRAVWMGDFEVQGSLAAPLPRLWADYLRLEYLFSRPRKPAAEAGGGTLVSTISLFCSDLPYRAVFVSKSWRKVAPESDNPAKTPRDRL